MAFDFGIGLGVISGITSIVGGVNASNSARSANRAAERRYQEQKEAQKKWAKTQNKYNMKVFEAGKKYYYAQREFQYDMQMRDYEYSKEIQDFTYLQQVRQYGKSVETYVNQMAFNSLAANEAYESVQAQLNEEIMAKNFAKQDLLVERMGAEAEAYMGQAGRSQQKGVQSVLASQGRALAMMREELRSAERQASREMRDVSMGRLSADLNAKANLMLRPERAPEPLPPVMGPERPFIEPLEVQPGFTAPPVQQDVMAPLIGGFTSGLSALAGINWSGASPGKTLNTTKFP